MSTLLLKKSENTEQAKNYIIQEYEAFLEDKRNRSVNTYKSYKGDLEQFFMIVYGKEPKFITMEDLTNTTGTDIVSYGNKLQELYKSAKTINRKLVASKQFFLFVEADNPEVRSTVFNKFKRVKDTKKRGYGVLTYEEVQQFIEIAKEYDNGEELSLLFEVAFKTCIRLEALLELTPMHFMLEHQRGQLFWVIGTMDKGEEHIKPITDKMKERIDLLGREKKEKVFKSFYKHKVGKIVKEISERLELDPRRNIRFHSFKKAGINFVYDKTGDIMMAKVQGNHKSAVTTVDSYMEEKKDYASMPSFAFDNEDVDMSILEGLSRSELIQLIKKTKFTTQLELVSLVKA